MKKYKRTSMALAPSEAPSNPAILQDKTGEQETAQQKTVNRTLRLPPAVYHLLRNLSHEEVRPMHSYYLEAIDLWLTKRGLPGFAELDGGRELT
ncbi:hypothetical protein [Sneathiella aquimaris]|uniref:hypothetical protein n=1 Tax=Sneathiella aquimaris TaxID=2599305 RepID=UPI00146C4524|nr:hypothetical protein [Sneathiella aquimaris]